MGNQKLKWTSDEEQALLAGVEIHGPGKWKNILKDPQFAHFLINRSNIDLKDKWRNLSVSVGKSPREKSKGKNNQVKTENSTPDSSTLRTACSKAALVHDSPNNSQDGTNAARKDAVIFEAISTMKQENGSDIGAIFNFVEQRHGTPLPPNFRRVLGTRLRKLVSQGKLEKVQNGYKLMKETRTVTPPKTPALSKKKVVAAVPKPSEVSASALSPENQAAASAAHKIADAENKSNLAAKAVKLAGEISMQLEESEAMLELATEIYAQCFQDEEVIDMA